MKSIYDEKLPRIEDSKLLEQKVQNTEDLYSEITHCISIKDSLIYLVGEIGEFSLFDFVSRCRTILRERPPENLNDPINLVVNSTGGNTFEMFGIIDFIKSLKVKVNVIVRGQAMSAAAMILTCGTGTRMCSKYSTIMLHEGSAFNIGKSSDIQASAKQYKRMENNCLVLLEEHTKKDAAWWKENTRTDLYLSAEEALELGIIDKIG